MSRLLTSLRTLVHSSSPVCMFVLFAALMLLPGRVHAQTVTSISPTSGVVGTTVTITGTDLFINDIGILNGVTFGSTSATYTVNPEGTTITTTVPSGAMTGFIFLDYDSIPVVITSQLFTVITAPSITSFSPASGPPGTLVTLTGSGFAGTTAVTIAGASCAFTVVSNTSLKATIPSGAAARSGPVSVTNPAQVATTNQNFTINAPTVVQSLTFSPTSILPGHQSTGTITFAAAAPTNGAITLTDGSNDNITFPNGESVTVHAGDAHETFTVSGQNITTNNTAVTVTVTATVVVGTTNESSASGTITSLPDAPVITLFTPTSGLPGTQVTILGSVFPGATAVAFNGTPTPFGIVNDGMITTRVPAGATTGPISVTGGGGTVTSSSASFTVLSLPTIRSVTFEASAVGEGTVAGIVTFAAAAQAVTTIALSASPSSALNLPVSLPVAVGDTQETFFVSGKSVTTLTPATVTASDSVSSAHGSINVVPMVSLASFSPASGPAGTLVTLTGAGFTLVSSISLNNGNVPSFTIVSDTEITLTIPAGATSGIFILMTPGIAALGTGTFTVIQPPAIISFSPVSGPVGQVVAINGAHFTGATSVTFNGTPATTFTVGSDSAIATAVPSGATTGAVSVTTPGGTVTSSMDFTVIPKPVITGFTPASAIVGSVITVSGSGFTGETAVTVGGVSVTPITVTDTAITFTLTSAVFSGPIIVTTPGGTATSATALTKLTWSAKDVADAADGTARTLWTRSDGAAGIWILTGANLVSIYGPTYGPISDTLGAWTAKAVKVAPDGTARMLWTRSDGAAGIWVLNALGAVTHDGPVYGPYTTPQGAWKASGLAVASDGTARLLWNRSDGAAGVWTLDAAGTETVVGTTYEPISDPHGTWTATGVGAADAGSSRLLWTRTDGAMGVWSLNAADVRTVVGSVYGPYPIDNGVWHATALGASSDGTSRVLWTDPLGAAGVWTFDATDTQTTVGPTYGPYAGYSAMGLDAAGEQARILWVRSDRAAGLWTLDVTNTKSVIGTVYGPF